MPIPPPAPTVTPGSMEITLGADVDTAGSRPDVIGPRMPPSARRLLTTGNAVAKGSTFRPWTLVRPGILERPGRTPNTGGCKVSNISDGRLLRPSPSIFVGSELI